MDLSKYSLEELFRIAKVNARTNQVALDVLEEIKDRLEEILRLHNEIDKLKSIDWI